MTQETIQSITEKIVGSYEWKRLSQDAKVEKISTLGRFVQQILEDFAILRKTSCGYEDDKGDTWTINELEFQTLFKKYSIILGTIS